MFLWALFTKERRWPWEIAVVITRRNAKTTTKCMGTKAARIAKTAKQEKHTKNARIAAPAPNAKSATTAVQNTNLAKKHQTKREASFPDASFVLCLLKI